MSSLQSTVIRVKMHATGEKDSQGKKDSFKETLKCRVSSLSSVQHSYTQFISTCNCLKSE